MVSTVKAVTFITALRSGRTCPCLMQCEDDKENNMEVVVKLYSGKESSKTALICELIASLLAQDLDLPAPTPFLIEVEPDFYKGIPDPELSERFRNSQGLNFGSLYLKGGYTTWPQDRSIPNALIQDAADIFAFDVMIQNPDRRKNKPNLLRKGDDLAIFDHEMAFSFLYALVSDEFPWEGKGMDFAKNHVFYNSLKGKDLSWDRLQGALEAIDNPQLDMYTEAIPEKWRKGGANAEKRIQEYIKKARDNSKKLFQKIAEVLI